MATERPITDYTNRDYDSLLTSMLNLAALKLPEWNDRSENDFGRLLLELCAHAMDVLCYYQDRCINEAFLATAIERRSVMDLLALIGYTLSTPAPASAELTVTAPNDTTEPIIIEPFKLDFSPNAEGAIFATEASPGKPAVEFIYLPENQTPLVIPRDGKSEKLIYPDPNQTASDDKSDKKDDKSDKKLTVINAVRQTDNPLWVSNGEPNQRFTLRQKPVLLPRNLDSQAYLRVEVDSGAGFQRWTMKGTLLYSKSGDQHFIVEVDENDAASIVFGDKTYGDIPLAGSLIRAVYLTGGGTIGNVGPHTITKAQGVNVDIIVSNPKAAAGGADRESIEHARRLAPAVYRSMQRAVTAEDYAALAENFPGVDKAIAIAPSWNYVDIYVIASSGTERPDTLPDTLVAEMLQYFESRRMVTTLVNIRPPVFVDINVTVVVGVTPNSYRDDVKERVQQALNDMFQTERLTFGYTFYLSDFYQVVESVDGVAFSDIQKLEGIRSKPNQESLTSGELKPSRLPLRPVEFPRRGTITVTARGGLG